MVSNRSHDRYEFTNTKINVGEKVGENSLPLTVSCLPTVFVPFTHQLEFANTSLPALVCHVEAV